MLPSPFTMPNMPDFGQTLLIIARNAIATRLGQPVMPVVIRQPELTTFGATFVTLTQHEQLRGCIGSLQAWRPLLTDVQENACAAAFSDPRFKPLTVDELGRTRVEVSLLEPAEPLVFTDQADALAKLRPDIDGIIFTAGRHRATFLPQVWEQLPNPVDFLAHLKLKAGLPSNYWGSDIKLERYTVRKWQELGP